MIYEKKICRLCNGPLAEVLQLTPTPLANSFPLEPDVGAERIPLNLNQCLECGHVQTSHVVSQETLYSEYKYSTPDAVRPHLETTAVMLRERYSLARRVLEIGCNNCLNLDVLTDAGFDAVGVDPATGESNNSVVGYFTPPLAATLGEFDLIVANNVFAHIDYLDEVFDAVNICLARNGTLLFEVQYLPDLVRNVGFDMIYHEHHDYHILKPLARFVRRFGLVLTDYEFIPTHGGSVRVFCQREGTEAMLPDEHIDWTTFQFSIEMCRTRTVERLKWASRNGGLIAFGAPAKACTMINHFGIADYFRYCVDSTPAKQGRYIPGTNIKIFEPDILRRSKSHKVLFLMAWNYEEVIRKQYSDMPDMEIIVPWRPQTQRLAA